ncbi:MAG: response regulator, partial [Dehalococcoidia bacterium]
MSQPSGQPLVIAADPDRDSRTTTARALTEAGYRVLEAGDGKYALRQAFTERPEAAIIELNMPLLSGLELVKVLRAASDMVLIVVADGTSRDLAVRLL